MWALAVIDAPSDVVSRKRKITPDRLVRAGEQAADRARKRVSAALKCDEDAVSVDCAYQGPEKEEEERNLHCLMKVKFLWSTSGGTLAHWVLAAKALHAGGIRGMPWEFKRPVVASRFPAPIM